MFAMAWVTPKAVAKLELSFKKQAYEFKDCFRACDDQLAKIWVLAYWNNAFKKNVNSGWNTNFSFYLETSGGQNSNLYSNVVYFFNTRVDYTAVAA
jgi:hypothetical protein